MILSVNLCEISAKSKSKFLTRIVTNEKSCFTHMVIREKSLLFARIKLLEKSYHSHMRIKDGKKPS